MITLFAYSQSIQYGRNLEVNNESSIKTGSVIDSNFENINFDIISEDINYYFITFKFKNDDNKFRINKDDVTITSLKSQMKISVNADQYLATDIQVQQSTYKEYTQDFKEYKELTIIK